MVSRKATDRLCQIQTKRGYLVRNRYVVLRDTILKRVGFVAAIFAIGVLALMALHNTLLKLVGAAAYPGIVQLSGRMIFLFAFVAAAATVTRKIFLAPMLVSER
jgi:hypothetical protein